MPNQVLHEGGGKGKLPRILIAEDNPAILDVLTILLESEGLEVVGTGDGTEAERLAVKLAPDVAMLDLMLPGLHGGEVCRRLRRNPDTRHIKIAFISALTPEEAARQGLSPPQPDIYITKPFDINQVAGQIHALLGSSREEAG